MTSTTRWWLLGGVLAATAIGAAAAYQVQRRNAESEAQRNRGKPALEFSRADLVRLERKPLAVEVELTGSVQAVSQASVRAKLAAEVKKVLVREGDRIAPGQTLAEFDTAQLRAQLAERNAALESARAQLTTAERTREANAQLVKQSFISKNAFDNAEGAYLTQLAAVSVAKAQLEQTRIQLEDAVVRAPIAGVVAKRHVQPGEKVGFDAPLVSIVDLSQLEVQAQASLADIAKIRPGMPARVEVEGLAERAFGGKVERINPSAEPGTRSIHVYVSLRNENELVRGGMFARVRLTLAADREAPALPASAIRGEGAQTYVWLIASGKLERRAVLVGTRDERSHFVEILSGVQPDEPVLATKFDQLEHGRAARVSGDGSTQAGEPAVPKGPPG